MYLREWRDEYAAALLAEDDPYKSARLKGSLKTLDRILELPDEISEYLKGVSDGTFKKITTERGVENVRQIRAGA